MPKQLPSCETAIKKGAGEPFFRPDEADRLARATRWIEQARGGTANHALGGGNLQSAEDKGR